MAILFDINKIVIKITYLINFFKLYLFISYIFNQIFYNFIDTLLYIIFFIITENLSYFYFVSLYIKLYYLYISN